MHENKRVVGEWAEETEEVKTEGEGLRNHVMNGITPGYG